MTYSHAVRYLTEPVPAHPAITAEAVLAEMGLGTVRPLGIRLPGGKRGRACGTFLSAAFRAAGVRVLSVTESSAFPLRERLLLDGEPLPTTRVAALCQRVRDGELRCIRAYAARPAKADRTAAPVPDASPALGTAQRLALLLAALLSDPSDPIAILLFIGGTDSPLCRAFAPLCPTLSRLVVVTAENADLSAVLPETRDVVSLSGGKKLYNRLTDACARSGSRLNMVTETNCTCGELRPGGQTLTFRRAESGSVTLPCAAPSVLLAALLAEAAFFCVIRQGLKLTGSALSAGFGTVRLPLYFSVRELSPLTLACSVDEEDDLAVSCGDLAALAPVLPRPIAAVVPAEWEAAFEQLLPAEARIYDRLLSPEEAEATGKNFAGTRLYLGKSTDLALRFCR